MAPVVLRFTNEDQAREVIDQHAGDNGCDECPPQWPNSSIWAPDPKRCPAFQAAVSYLSAPIEPEPMLPQVRFDALRAPHLPEDATRVLPVVTDSHLTGATR